MVILHIVVKRNSKGRGEVLKEEFRRWFCEMTMMSSMGDCCLHSRERFSSHVPNVAIIHGRLPMRFEHLCY